MSHALLYLAAFVVFAASFIIAAAALFFLAAIIIIAASIFFIFTACVSHFIFLREPTGALHYRFTNIGNTIDIYKTIV
jgi:hypothetical protein